MRDDDPLRRWMSDPPTRAALTKPNPERIARTDDPIRDFATGAWLYTMALCLFGYWLTVTQCPIRNR